MSEKNTTKKDPMKKVLEDEKDSKPSTVINTKGSKTTDDEAEGPELIPETYTKKKPALTSYDDDMSKAKAKAIAERNMGVRAIPKKKASFQGKTDGKPFGGSVKDSNKDGKTDDGPELIPETLTKKLTDDDMSKAKAKAIAERNMGVRAIPKKKASFQGKTDGKPFGGSVKDSNKDGKTDDGPELIPETSTKKLTDDDMSKAKAKAIAERSMGIRAIPKKKASVQGETDGKPFGGSVKDASKDAKTDDGPELIPETSTKKLTDEDMATAKAKARMNNKATASTKITYDEMAKAKATAAKAKTEAAKKVKDDTFYDNLDPDSTDLENREIAESNRSTNDRNDELNHAAEDAVVTTTNIASYDAGAPGAVVPGAVAVPGIGGGDETNEWQTFFMSGDEEEGNEELHSSHFPVEEANAEVSEEHLIKAVVVDDDAIPEAEAVSEETLDRNRRRNFLFCIAGLIIIVVTIVLAAVLSRKAAASQITQSPTQSSIPSMAPSEVPSLSPTTSVQLFLESLDEGLEEAFMDSYSAQAKALSWLELNHTSTPIYDYPNQRIVQRFVLATLYYSLGGENWIKSNDWLSSKHECDWASSHENRQERCGTSSDSVLYELKLNFNRLKGTLPREIYLLSQLTVLDFSANAIRGSIPSELGLMKSLSKINLKENSLNGGIPKETSLLHENLSFLDFSSNSLDGPLPSTLGQLTNLEELDVSDNVLSGTLCSELGTLSRITSIALADNSLSGTIPSVFESLQQLEVLELSNNLLFGSIPLLLQLNELNIGSNFMSGSIATRIGLMTRLEVLDVSNNLLIGTVPSELGELSKLESLHMNINGITGVLPPTMTNLTKLETLDITRNSIIGTLPANIHLMERLEVLGLSFNSMNGSLPAKLSTMSNLKILNLGTNEITGTLPEDLHLMERLEILGLSFNSIIGTLPEKVSLMSNLKTLDLVRNEITGTLPEDIHLMEGLEIFNLNANSIRGSLPASMSMMINLKLLDLFGNGITGALPEDLHMMESLETLGLNANSIRGSLPEMMSMMSNLKILDLSKNDITGTLPEDIYLMESLEFISLIGNSINGSIPSGIGSLTNLEYLNLAYNSVTGTIPTEMGLLSNIDYFNIHYTDLSGSVPSEVCTMRQSRVVDFFAVDCDDIIICDCCFDSCPVTPRISNSSFNCTDDTTLLQVAVGTDRNPEGVEWDVIDGSSNEIVLEGGPLTQYDHSRTILYETCIPNDACLVFTVRGSNTNGGGLNGDHFMVHLNGSEISNGRFQNYDEQSEFFLGQTSSSSCTTGVTTDRKQACSVTHENCENIGLTCFLDNMGGVSGFCGYSTSGSFSTPSISPMPSFLPSASSAPSSTTAPSTSPSLTPSCTLCEDGSAPPLGSLVVSGTYFGGQTCSQVNTALLNQELAFHECQDYQATFGIACGCNNSIALESFPVSCIGISGGRDIIPRFPFKKVLGDFTCLDGTYWVNSNDLTSGENVDPYKSACCDQTCSKTDSCSDGYFCTFENNKGTDGICKFCGVPDEISSTCFSLTLSSEGNADCVKSCIDNLECNADLSSIRIDITTDVFLSETSWTLQDESSGEVIAEGGDYYSADSEITFASQTFVSQECVSNDSCLLFTIYESSDSGLGEPGQFILYWNNKQVASSRGSFMGKSETVRIGEACRETETLPSTPAKTSTPSFAPSSLPSSVNPLLLPPCQDGMVNITVDIHIENDPQHTAWTLANSNYDGIVSSNGGSDVSNIDNILLQGGPYLTSHFNNISDLQSICVAPDSCLEWIIKDPQERAAVSSPLGMDSNVYATANLYADGIKIATAGFYGQTVSIEVGMCSPIE